MSDLTLLQLLRAILDAQQTQAECLADLARDVAESRELLQQIADKVDVSPVPRQNVVQQ